MARSLRLPRSGRGVDLRALDGSEKEGPMAMTRRKKILLALGVVALLSGGAVTLLPNLLWGDGVDYSKVDSMKTTIAYQDPARPVKVTD